MYRNAQNSGLAILTPTGMGVCGHFIKWYFEVHEMSRSAQKTSCMQLLEWDQFTKRFLLGISSNVQHWIENSCLARVTAHWVGWGGSQFTKRAFCYELQKCLELYRKVMFAKPKSVYPGLNFSLLRFNEMSRSAEKVRFPNPHLHVSSGGVEGVNLQKKC